MSTAVVGTVAWVALAGVVVLGVALVVVHRRLRALSRAQSDRKWELAVLRAETGELRRRLLADDPDAATPQIPEQPSGDAAADGGRRHWPASPTAWRRARSTARPRRRRPG